MVLLQRMIVLAVLSLLPLKGSLSEWSINTGSYTLLAAKQQTKRRPHVYTNDDHPFNHSPAEPPATGKDAAAGQPPEEKGGERLAPFVPTPLSVVEKMLDMAKVTSRDVVYDLGSGDGRIVLMAAQKYGAKAVGVELDRHLVEESREKVLGSDLKEKVTIIQDDLLKTSVDGATVVTVYLLPDANQKLRPILERDLKPGTRVVSHDMRIPGWQEDRHESVAVGATIHYVYLYQIPEAFRH